MSGAGDWRWYVLAVEGGREFEVQQELIERELHCFLPLRHLWRARNRVRRRDLVAEAWVRGYCFLGLEPLMRAAWKPILEVPGVLGVLGHDGRPQEVWEPGLIPMLASSSRPVAYLNLPRRRRRKGKGQRSATILNGPYAGKLVRTVEVIDADPEIYCLFER